MANAWYPIYKQNLLAGTSGYDLDNDNTTDGPFCALVDLGTYTYSAAHDFYNDLSGVVGTDQRLTAPTVTNGTLDAGDLTYTSVSGNSVEALIIYRHNSGANTTWPLALFLDTSVTGLPVTPNGGNITVTWNASGISTISDRRLKENLKEVGSLYGILPIYQFNYVGSEELVRGLMAQEVEKVASCAVIDFPRFKAVDYDRAVEACERLAA